MKFFNISVRNTAQGWGIYFAKKQSNSTPGRTSDVLYKTPPREKKQIKLNVGGAKGHPKMSGWIVVDMRSHADVVMDISKQSLPYEDDEVDLIFCSHTLEHIIPQRLDYVLKEFHRVLNKTTGLLRISVPDIEIAINAYKERDLLFFENSEVAPNFKDAPMGGLFASWCYSTRLDRLSGEESEMRGHVHCFDYDYLAWCLSRSKFEKVWRSQPRRSACPELRNSGFDRHLSESLFVEAVPLA